MVGSIEDFTDKQCRMVVSRPKRVFFRSEVIANLVLEYLDLFLIFVTDSTMVNTIIWENMFWNFFGQNTRNCVIFDVRYGFKKSRQHFVLLQVHHIFPLQKTPIQNFPLPISQQQITPFSEVRC